MARKAEGRFKDRVTDQLDKVSGLKYHCPLDVQKGIPDIIIVWLGKPLYVELKVEGGYVDPLQRLFLEDAYKAGAIAGVLEESAKGPYLWYRGGFSTEGAPVARDAWWVGIVHLDTTERQLQV